MSAARANKTSSPCSNKVKQACIGRGQVNGVCSHALCRQCCLAASRAEYIRCTHAGILLQVKRWCRVTLHNYEPPATTTDSGISGSGPPSAATRSHAQTPISAPVAPLSHPPHTTVTSESESPQASSQSPELQHTHAAGACATPSLWQATPPGAIAAILERDTQARAAAQRKQVAAHAQSTHRNATVAITIWSQVSLCRVCSFTNTTLSSYILPAECSVYDLSDYRRTTAAGDTLACITPAGVPGHATSPLTLFTCFRCWYRISLRPHLL